MLLLFQSSFSKQKRADTQAPTSKETVAECCPSLIVSCSAPLLPMTVIQLLTAQPERKDKAFSFFGVFPFLQAAYIPYNIHLYTIEKRTSTLKKYVFAS